MARRKPVVTSNGMWKQTEQMKMRFRALANTLTKTDRILTRDRKIAVKIADTGELSRVTGINGMIPAASTYPNIFINYEAFDDLKKKSTLVAIIGANYHELSHILFTPRRMKAKVAQIMPEGLRAALAYNILEDQRIESFFTALYEPAGKFFAETFVRFIMADPAYWDVVFVYSYGRSYLPMEIRDEFEARFKRPDLIEEIKDLIDSFKAYKDPNPDGLIRVNNPLRKIIARFTAIMDELGDDRDTDCGGSEQGSGSPDQEKSQEAQSKDRKRRNKEERTGEDQSNFWDEDDEDEDGDEGQDSEGGSEDSDGDESGDSESSEDDDGSPDGEDSDHDEPDSGDQGDPSEGDESDGDSEGDGDSEDSVDGDGDSGDSDGGDDDESASDSASGDNSDGEDSDGDGPSADGDDSDESGEPGEEDSEVDNSPEGGTSSETSDWEPQFSDEELSDYLDDISDAIMGDSAVDTEVSRIHNAMNDSMNIDVIDFDKAVGTEVVPSNVARSALRDVTRTFKQLHAEVEPGWKYGSDTGRLNIGRVIADPDNYDEMFDEWDEGREQDTGLEVFIAFDISFSMACGEINGRAPIEIASEALWVLKRAFDELDAKVTVVGFHEDTLGLYDRNKKADRGSYIVWGDLGGATDPMDAFKLGRTVLTVTPMPNKLFITITDGAFTRFRFGGPPNDPHSPDTYEEAVDEIPGTKMYVGVGTGAVDANKETRSHFNTISQITDPMEIVPLVKKTVEHMLRSRKR